MKFLITTFQDEDGIFISECPSIPGCVSQGKTEQEAEKNIQEAIKECLEVRAEKGIPLTVKNSLPRCITVEAIEKIFSLVRVEKFVQ